MHRLYMYKKVYIYNWFFLWEKEEKHPCVYTCQCEGGETLSGEMCLKLIVNIQRLDQIFAKYQAMHFTNVMSFNPCNHPRKQVLLLWEAIFQYGSMEVGSNHSKSHIWAGTSPQVSARISSPRCSWTLLLVSPGSEREGLSTRSNVELVVATGAEWESAPPPPST